MMRACCLAILSLAALLGAQSNLGELRLKVTDASGLALESSVELVSQANQIRKTLSTDQEGNLAAKRLPFGQYRLEVKRTGFAPFSDVLEIRSALPLERRVTLGFVPVETRVVVREAATLIDPHVTGAVNRIGPGTLQDRRGSSPGRSVIDLVNTQPGWLLEANGVLHPRGSEYQTQYVIDGIPLTENRSPAFAPEIGAEDIQSMNVLTGNYPAEYGRKLGGVIEVTTARDSRQGFHGTATAFGGSFAAAGGSLLAQYGSGRNTFTLSSEGSRTDRYLDAPVEQNYTNLGTESSFSAHFERDLKSGGRFSVIARHEQVRFLVPDEQIQQEAGQRQDRTSCQNSGQFSYQHIFSPNVLGDLHGVVRDVSAALWSNPLATPILAAQDRGFRETYLRGSVSIHAGRNEWKAGVEGDFASVRERFGYQLTDPSQFDADTPAAFNFADRRQDREQSLFVQDRIRAGNWTISAGLRWDHYRLLVDESALSPRLGVAWFWRSADLVFHASYDRVFQTPAVENLLLASSAAAGSLNDHVLRLPVRPSRGNFYEAGLTKGLFGKLKLDANYFQRFMNNFADDDLLLNTGVSFPIAFRKADIHGAEIKLEIPRWGPVSGFVSYSNMTGVGYLPITGGLFLGDDAGSALNSSARFPVTQDQRNSVRSRFRYQILPRLWAALGGSYGSGLPVEFTGDRDDAIAAYGQRIVDRVNFERGRVRPSFSLDASLGANLWHGNDKAARIQGDVLNLTNRLNVIDFAGLLSGTALAPPRSFSLRLQVEF